MEISVIIPIYNVENYLNQCVDSVLAQNFTDYEIILVDDGSTDNSPSICDEYAEKYGQIKVIHKTNGGLSDARNFGIKEAQGNYLMFLDSDDFWNGVIILSEINEIIKKSNPDLIIHELSCFYDLKRIIPRKFKTKETQNFSYNLKKDLKYLVNNDIYYAAAWNKIIKSEIVKANQLYFPKGKIHEDVAWCADIIPYISSYSLYKKPFYYYRKGREGSLTVQIRPKNIIDLIDIISEKEELVRRFIIEDLHSGATIYESIGAYNMKKRHEIITIVDKSEYQKLMNFINNEDPKAFVTVYNVSDMRYQPKV